MTKFSSPVPVGHVLTSKFGPRWGTTHAGTDWAPIPPKRGVPVMAIAKGRVIMVGRGNGTANSAIPYHSGRYVYIDLGFIGGDRMYQYVGHLQSFKVKVGDRVVPGQIIGIEGGSGARTDHDFGQHSHIGIAMNTTRPIANVEGRGGKGWIDPARWLASKGIRPGITRPVAPGVVATVKAAITRAKTKPKHVRKVSSIRAILIRAGHITKKNTTGLGIQRYQHRQLAPFTLVHDRHWGAATEAHYKWTHRLQTAMNDWRYDGDPLRVDGDYRKLTRDRVEHIQRRNHGKAYIGKVDGVPGPIFCRMLGIPNHP